MKKKVKIIEDFNSEMLKIEIDNNCVFEGNYWDFDRSGSGFKKLLSSIGLDVELLEKDYEEWYENNNSDVDNFVCEHEWILTADSFDQTYYCKNCGKSS